MAILTPQFVREYISDFAPKNYLLDGEEMSDTFINLCIQLGLDSFNSMAPMSGYTVTTIPSMSILMYGTLYHAFLGKSALLARNTMQYSDGGLQIPIEERSELYQQLSSQFFNIYQPLAQKLKIEINMENGWGGISSDERMFPVW